MKTSLWFGTLTLAATAIVGGAYATVATAQSSNAPDVTETVLACMAGRGFDLTAEELAAVEVPERFAGPRYLAALYGDTKTPAAAATPGIAKAHIGDRKFAAGVSCNTYGSLAGALNADYFAEDAVIDDAIKVEALSPSERAAAVGEWQDCMVNNGLDVINPDDVAAFIEAEAVAVADELGYDPATDEGTPVEDAYAAQSSGVTDEIVAVDDACRQAALRE